jgi:hypothetical protein
VPPALEHQRAGGADQYQVERKYQWHMSLMSAQVRNAGDPPLGKLNPGTFSATHEEIPHKCALIGILNHALGGRQGEKAVVTKIGAAERIGSHIVVAEADPIESESQQWIPGQRERQQEDEQEWQKPLERHNGPGPCQPEDSACEQDHCHRQSGPLERHPGYTHPQRGKNSHSGSDDRAEERVTKEVLAAAQRRYEAEPKDAPIGKDRESEN